MDLYKTIRELYEEKQRLDQVIRSLEVLLERGQTEVSETEPLPKRRGRKSMAPKERKQVAERMKKYWEDRRKNQ